jgi:hypothetical protein
MRGCFADVLHCPLGKLQRGGGRTPVEGPPVRSVWLLQNRVPTHAAGGNAYAAMPVFYGGAP